MSKFYHRILSEGAAINDATSVFTSSRRLTGLLVHLSSAAATSENFTLSLDSGEGSAWDVVLYKVDLGAAGLADLAYTDFNLPILAGDALKVTYANTDSRTIGVTLVLE